MRPQQAFLEWSHSVLGEMKNKDNLFWKGTYFHSLVTRSGLHQPILGFSPWLVLFSAHHSGKCLMIDWLFFFLKKMNLGSVELTNFISVIILILPNFQAIQITSTEQRVWKRCFWPHGPHELALAQNGSRILYVDDNNYWNPWKNTLELDDGT
jgi:hypothetical protein